MAIDKKTLEYLAELSRIDLDKRSEAKLLKDLQEILDYFEQLKEVDTENVNDVSIHDLKNVFREDNSSADSRGPEAEARGKLTKQFPEEENGYLKIPPVFD